jgi:hypothetical protein
MILDEIKATLIVLFGFLLNSRMQTNKDRKQKKLTKEGHNDDPKQLSLVVLASFGSLFIFY